MSHSVSQTATVRNRALDYSLNAALIVAASFLVAALVGYIAPLGKQSFLRAAVACVAGEILLFICGLSWLYTMTHSLRTAIALGLYWFVFAEVIKIMLAAGARKTWQHVFPRT